MAARPNTVRTLEYGHRLAVNHVKRLKETIDMAETVISTNSLLTKEDITSYKECISAAKKQLTLFEKAIAVALPKVKLSTRRKRGRPSKAELETLEAQRKGRPVKAAKAAPVAVAKAKVAKTKAVAKAAPVPEPKRRGRPPKNAAAAAPAAPKGKPGRKPKRVGDIDVSNLTDAQRKAVEAVLAGTPKRRGRPPKAKTTFVASTSNGIHTPANGVDSADDVAATQN